MKVLIIVFSLFIVPFAFSQSVDSQGVAEEEPRSVDEMVSYIDQLLEREEEPVTCANMSEAIKAYLDLSQTNQTLLTVSANRLLGVLPSDVERAPEKTEALSADITRAVQSIGDGQFILSDKAFFILEALPDCLKE